MVVLCLGMKERITTQRTIGGPKHFCLALNVMLPFFESDGVTAGCIVGQCPDTNGVYHSFSA